MPWQKRPPWPWGAFRRVSTSQCLVTNGVPRDPLVMRKSSMGVEEWWQWWWWWRGGSGSTKISSFIVWFNSLTLDAKGTTWKEVTCHTKVDMPNSTTPCMESSVTCPILRHILGYTNDQQLHHKCHLMTLGVRVHFQIFGHEYVQ
jgi:hypothetical protein